MSLLDGILNTVVKEVKKAAAESSKEPAEANNPATPAPQSGPKGGSTTKRIAPKQEMFCFYDKNGSLRYYYLTDYDDDDRIMRKTSYNPNGSKIIGYDYEYNEHGDVVWGTWTAYSNPMLFRQESRYDEKFRIIDRWNHGDESQNVVGFRSLMHYDHDDSKADSMETFNCAENGARGNVVIYRHQYNEEHSCITETLIYHEDEDEPFAKRGFEYDNAGNRTKEWHESPLGTLVYTDVMRYDENGKLIDTTRYDKDGKLESVRVN